MADNRSNEEVYLRRKEFVIREHGIYQIMFPTGGYSSPYVFDDDDAARSFLRDFILKYCEEYDELPVDLRDSAIMQIGLIRDRCSGSTVESRNKIIAYGKEVVSQ